MKALSIRGDYVRDIIEGRKTIEYRTWTTKYRGELLLCSTTKKVEGAAPSYALAVAKITDIEWDELDQCYHWKIAPFEENGSYLIEPLKVKGQLKLFNVDDNLIHKAPFIKVNHSNEEFDKWWNETVQPLIYKPKRKVKRKILDIDKVPL